MRADAPLATWPWLRAKEVELLDRAGLRSLTDLLEWLPKRHEDRRRFDAFPLQAGASPVCLRGRVADVMPRRFGGGRSWVEAVVVQPGEGLFATGKVTCRWFNMPLISRIIAAGQELVIYGRVKETGGRLVIDHPEFEILGEIEVNSIHLERIVPIYRNVSGISQRRLRESIHQALAIVDPASFGEEHELDPGLPRAQALCRVHFPDRVEDAEAARRLFALEEFFKLQLQVLWRRARHRAQTGRVQGVRTTLLKRFHASLPFELTGAQKRSIKEIAADMRSPRPMHRLLQGDVGAGKTFVAMAAMLLAVDSGAQAALMAPTQILAEQHFLTFRRWLEPLGVRIALRTGSREDRNHGDEGDSQIVIGTHALLYDNVAFRDLSLVVIDEQHKFGVAQREALEAQARMPDVLVMTATPIPRSLALTVYGDLDVSLLDEKPAGRGRIVTALRAGAKQTDITKFVRSLLAEGRQAYLVYPLVEDNEALKIESATVAAEKWRKRLPGHEVGLIHGKLSADEKDKVMTAFREGEIQALVATTVIEVGVDVPNASLMILHHAERFGLAQIHQLRGRIGRGGHKGWCVLLTDGKNPEALDKLRVLESTADGFEIAEADLNLRGPGDVLGTAQSGLRSLKFAEYLTDWKLLKQAREMAHEIFSQDPELAHHPKLRRKIEQ